MFSYVIKQRDRGVGLHWSTLIAIFSSENWNGSEQLSCILFRFTGMHGTRVPSGGATLPGSSSGGGDRVPSPAGRRGRAGQAAAAGRRRRAGPGRPGRGQAAGKGEGTERQGEVLRYETGESLDETKY